MVSEKNWEGNPLTKSGIGYASKGPFPFPSSFQFREAEKATLEAFFEKVFFAKPVTSQQLEAIGRVKWRTEQSDQDPGEGAEGAQEQAPEEGSGEQAEAEARYVLLCRGADGIGKTRIFQHLSERAREKEVAIYETQNYEVEGIPYDSPYHARPR